MTPGQPDQPETAEIKCPQCSTVSEVRGGEHTFCSTCDFPLFWANPTQSALRPAVQSAAVGEEAHQEQSPDQPEEPAPEDDEEDLDAQATDIICRNCALRNPGDRTYCMRCGHELPPPEEWFNPDEPTQVEAEPEKPLWRSLITPIAGLIVVAAVTLGVLHFVFDVFSDDLIIVVNTVVSDEEPFVDSIAIVLEGKPPIPIIAYRNTMKNQLRVAVCTDLECSGVRNSEAVDKQGSPGLDLAMARISSGPVIVYRRQPTASLIAVNCGSVECDDATGARGFFAVDESQDVGYEPAMAVRGGVPVVVYSNGEGQLHLAYLCGSSCSDSGGVIITELPGVTEPGTPVSIAIPLAASPYISFWNSETESLQLIHCLDVTCNTRSPGQPIELIRGAFGPQTAMVIDGKSLSPTIAFRDVINGQLVLLACGDEECTPAARAREVIDRGGRDTADHDVGHDIVMKNGPDGFPVIAYRDETAGQLLIAVCTDLPCTRDTVVIDVVDNGGTGDGRLNVGYGTSMAITGDTAVIAYADEGRTELRVARVDISRVLKRAAARPVTAEPTAPQEQQ